MTELSNLPMLVKCDKSKANGVCGNDYVRVISHDALLKVEELTEYVESFAAAAAGDREEMESAFDRYPCKLDDSQEKCTTLRELDHTLNFGANEAKVVIWRGKETNFRRLGLLCNTRRTVEALLILLHYSSIKLKLRRECIVCGEMMESQRPNRKKTCTDACRKQLSRMRSAKLQSR